MITPAGTAAKLKAFMMTPAGMDKNTPRYRRQTQSFHDPSRSKNTPRYRRQAQSFHDDSRRYRRQAQSVYDGPSKTPQGTAAKLKAFMMTPAGMVGALGVYWFYFRKKDDDDDDEDSD